MRLPRVPFAEAGGFPDGTIAEDMDYTWRAMLAGGKAVFVSGAEAYVVDPKTVAQLQSQLWRWLSGYFQCVREHWKEVIRRKRILAALVIVSIWDVFSMPTGLWVSVSMAPSTVSTLQTAEWIARAIVATDMFFTLPIVLYGAYRRRIPMWWVLINFPCIWFNRAFNMYYATKALIWELILVPCGWKQSLSVWVKGH